MRGKLSSDYLYGLDIPFDVDADGDMLLVIFSSVCQRKKDFEQSFTAGKTTYLIQGSRED